MTEYADVLSRLPHREPFRFVTRVVQRTQGKQASGIWSISGSEHFFAGHFPGDPIVPGVLIGEALAQLSGLIGDDRCKTARLAQIDLKIHAAVTPPADLSLHSRLTRSLSALHLYEVEARLGDKVIADGRLTLASGPENRE